jgi:hypothetical protein
VIEILLAVIADDDDRNDIPDLQGLVMVVVDDLNLSFLPFVCQILGSMEGVIFKNAFV